MAIVDKTGNGTARANGKANGQGASKRKTVKQQQRGFFAWATSLIARITTWAAIFTIIFRCPASLEACDEQSPFVCKPYFRVKNAVVPHVQPYIDNYASPYVDVARPYYDTLNTHVLVPTRQYAVFYGTPWVLKGQAFARSQWEMNGQPQLARLQTFSKAQYDHSIAPHMTKANDIVDPYYQFLRMHSLMVYNDFLLPGYELARPYAVRGYDAATEFTITTALPATYWAWSRTNAFLETAVWPQLRIVYVENVEPQLLRIGERLGRYRLKSLPKIKPVSDGSPIGASSSTSSISPSVSSSFSKPPPQSPSSSLTSTSTEISVAPASESTQKPVEQYWNPVEPPPVVNNESEVRKNAREMVANDLLTWQNKFAAQADEGASDMEDRVDEIARTMMNENARVSGMDLLKQLNETITFEIVDLKRKIASIVASGTLEAQQEIIAAVRSAGVAIKKKAQVIRGWREDYDEELQETVLDAADAYFQILDNTRSLALQNIGMKWAWTDGVTYKDWQKYHELKNTLNDWTEELKQLIVSHPTLLEAQELSHQIEDDGMAMATTAASELARLKEVAHWKILANDSTDNFDLEEMQRALEAAQTAKRDEEEAALKMAREEREAASKDVAGDETDKEDNADSVQDAVDESKSKPGKPAPGEPETSFQSFASHVWELSTPIENPAPEESITVVDQKPEKLDDGPIILGYTADDDPTAEPSKDSVIPEETEDDVILVSSATGPNSPEHATTHTGSDDVEATSVNYNTPVSPAMFGAAAQTVADRSPILDEDDSDSDLIASMTSAAQAAYSSAVAIAADRYSSAVSVVSAQAQGTSKPVHEQLFSSVSAVYDGAVSAANQKFQDAVTAASSGVYGATPTPTKSSNALSWDKVEAIAAQRLNEGRLWAEIQYQSVLIALRVATPTPTSKPDQYYEQAKYHYYAGLGMAQDRYSRFLAAASSAWSSVTATPTPTDLAGSASSMVSVAGKSAASAAHAADEAVRGAYSAASEGVMSAAQDAEDALHRAADAAADQIVDVAGVLVDTWDVVVSQISADIYGEPSAIGWYDSATASAESAVSAATEAASKQFDSINKLVSELVHGKEPTFSESVMSRLSAAYVTATSNIGSMASEASEAAASVGEKVGSAASHATDVVKDSVHQGRDEL